MATKSRQPVSFLGESPCLMQMVVLSLLHPCIRVVLWYLRLNILTNWLIISIYDKNQGPLIIMGLNVLLCRFEPQSDQCSCYLIIYNFPFYLWYGDPLPCSSASVFWLDITVYWMTLIQSIEWGWPNEIIPSGIGPRFNWAHCMTLLWLLPLFCHVLQILSLDERIRTR